MMAKTVITSVKATSDRPVAFHSSRDRNRLSVRINSPLRRVGLLRPPCGLHASGSGGMSPPCSRGGRAGRARFICTPGPDGHTIRVWRDRGGPRRASSRAAPIVAWETTMRQVVLGKSGLKVSAVGCGGIPIQRVSMEEAVRTLRAALDAGVTFFDTAAGYTDSQLKIGAAIQGRRDGAGPGLQKPPEDRATASWRTSSGRGRNWASTPSTSTSSTASRPPRPGRPSPGRAGPWRGCSPPATRAGSPTSASPPTTSTWR